MQKWQSARFSVIANLTELDKHGFHLIGFFSWSEHDVDFEAQDQREKHLIFTLLYQRVHRDHDLSLFSFDFCFHVTLVPRICIIQNGQCLLLSGTVYTFRHLYVYTFSLLCAAYLGEPDTNMGIQAEGTLR